MSKVKICGLYREEDVMCINEVCPDYAGFIIDFPKSHRSIGEETAHFLISKLNRDIKSVGVFVDKSQDFISRFNFVDVVQLHGNEDNEYIKALRIQMPQVEIWKAFKIRSSEDIKEAKNSIADIVLLDNGYGTGESFDWDTIIDFNQKFILAGGINSENIQMAIERLNPYALDVSSGVETEKFKDFNKIKKLIKIVRSNENE